MNAVHGKIGGRKRRAEQGFTLIETLVAAMILLICSVGVLSLFAVAIVRNANQGDDATRCTEYAQDKMEQLKILQFTDSSSDTTQTPTCNTNIPQTVAASTTACTASGTGLGSTTKGAQKGGLDPTSPVTGYVDYVDAYGSYSSTLSASSQFQRQWYIETNSTGDTKTIYVLVVSLRSLSKFGALAPRTLLVSTRTGFDVPTTQL